MYVKIESWTPLKAYCLVTRGKPLWQVSYHSAYMQEHMKCMNETDVHKDEFL